LGGEAGPGCVGKHLNVGTFSDVIASARSIAIGDGPGLHTVLRQNQCAEEATCIGLRPASLRCSDHGYFRTVKIYTVGYEGLALDEFLQQLRRARVQIVVDVRDVPLSRKRGFSKTALAAALGAGGVKYLHVRSLGCPKPIRDQYRTNKDWNAYTSAFMAHLREQTDAVGELAAVCKTHAAALLCYEANADFCHRTYVARAAAAIAGGSVLHIGAAGVTRDRAIAVAAKPGQGKAG
jgi:hypothetical protein